MNVLVFGATGQVGLELQRQMWPSTCRLSFPTRAEADFSDPASLAAVVAAESWTVIVNAAAYTEVDRAESDPDAAWRLNADAPAEIARLSNARGIPFIHISTDYVFDGLKVDAYVEDDPVRPVSAYGASKEVGEQGIRAATDRHVILRTAWVFSPFRKNFLKTMLNLAKTKPALGIVDDQRGCPTAAEDIARAIIQIVAALRDAPAREPSPARFGTFHFAGDEQVTWFGFAQAIFAAAEHAGLKVPEVRPITTADYPTPARRPQNSTLSCDLIRRTFGIEPSPWRRRIPTSVAEIIASDPSFAEIVKDVPLKASS